MSIYRQFLVTAALSAVVLGTGAAAAWAYQFGAPLPAAYDLPRLTIMKERAAQNFPSPKVLVVGDSNVLFGFNSFIASQVIGKPVVNFGLHGGLPIDWLMQVAKRNAKPGDTVVFSLVWNNYQRDYRVPEDWYVDQMIAWDGEYFVGLPIKRKLDYIKAISMRKWWSNIEAKIDSDEILAKYPRRAPMDPSEVVQYYVEESPKITAFDYSYVNSSVTGDMMRACGNVTKVSGMDALLLHTGVHPAVLALLQKTAKELEARGITVYFSPAVIIDDKITRADDYRQVVNGIWQQLRAGGLHAIGTPDEYRFPVNAFFDTSFHLNCQNVPERSRRVAADIMAASHS